MGLGRLLIEKAVSEAESRGKRLIWPGVLEKNGGAVRFYKKHGFYEAEGILSAWGKKSRRTISCGRPSPIS